MTEKERILRAIEYRDIDKVPHHIDFTIPAREKMARFLGDNGFLDKWGNHLAFIKAIPPHGFSEIKPGFVRDEWGVVWDRHIDPDIGNPTPILEKPSLSGYRFPDPDDPRRFEAIPDFVEKNRNKFLLLRQTYTLFERAWSLRGMENLLSDMVMNPDFVEDLLDHINYFNLRVIDQALDMGLDGVHFGDDWGWQQGLIMGPHLWRKFIKPRLAELIALAKKKGKKATLHSCGKVQEILPDLVEIGLDVFNPFQPEVMDIFAIKRQYQGRLAFWGGISIQRLLPFGTPEEVRREVKRIIEEIGKSGGYIAAPSHALPKDIPCENILAMMEVIWNQ
ncbi:uroporphyrinogen decarboxylase family protein [Thermatribacter velox]|uniref:Uroporphyrinogen decarboxylase family protein n=1 Tax=Thermatribacter velox TaxID=3039681 RepID=A0ABZ2Y8T3_9BACT